MNIDLTEARAAGESILRGTFPEIQSVEQHWTEGATLVLEGRSDHLSVFFKATAERDVMAEAFACRTLRDADLAAPEIVAHGRSADVPGGDWIVVKRAHGIAWDPQHSHRSVNSDVQRSLAAFLYRAHQVHLPGYGHLRADGRGSDRSWSAWVANELDRSLGALVKSGYLAVNQRQEVEALFDAHASCFVLERGSLLHGDLDAGEVFICETSGEVTGVVDWGDALVGDPLYDLARFASGGPAYDQRPNLLQPGLVQAYARYLDKPPREIARSIGLYRVLWWFRHSASYLGEPDEASWTPGLCRQGLELVADVPD